MYWRNILSVFKSDNLLDNAWQQSFEMLEIAEEMFCESIEVLRQTESNELRKEVREKDKKINEYQQEVRRKVLTHCAVQGGEEVPGGLVLASIVIDLERLGDYTKNIVDLVTYYSEKLHGAKFEEDLSQIEEAVRENFKRTRACFENSDEEGALALLKDNKWVSRACDKCIKQLVKEKDKNIASGQAAALALYLRSLKRINSHLRNITTSIVNPFDRIGFKPQKKT